jgi:opacity protein-like surface antigen
MRHGPPEDRVSTMKALLSSLLLVSSVATPAVAQSVSEAPEAAQPPQLSEASQRLTQNSSNTLKSTATRSNQLKGFYLTGALGGNFPTNSTAVETSNLFGTTYSFVDTHTGGFSAEVGGGYDFGSIRTEITYAYDGSTLANYSDQYGSYQYTGGSVNKNSVFASAYWDINLNSRLTPYIGGGIGYSNLNVSPSGDAISGANAFAGYSAGAFAYQVKVGLSYLLSRRADAFVEGLYRGMGGYNTIDNGIHYSYSDYNSWGVQLGARVRL